MNDLPGKRDMERSGETHGFRVNARLLVGGLIAIVLLVFILSNRDRQTVDFLIFEFDVPLWLALAVTALLGAAAGALLLVRYQHRKAKQR